MMSNQGKPGCTWSSLRSWAPLREQHIMCYRWMKISESGVSAGSCSREGRSWGSRFRSKSNSAAMGWELIMASQYCPYCSQFLYSGGRHGIAIQNATYPLGRAQYCSTHQQLSGCGTGGVGLGAPVAEIKITYQRWKLTGYKNITVTVLILSIHICLQATYSLMLRQSLHLTSHFGPPDECPPTAIPSYIQLIMHLVQLLLIPPMSQSLPATYLHLTLPAFLRNRLRARPEPLWQLDQHLYPLCAPHVPRRWFVGQLLQAIREVLAEGQSGPEECLLQVYAWGYEMEETQGQEWERVTGHRRQEVQEFGSRLQGLRVELSVIDSGLFGSFVEGLLQQVSRMPNRSQNFISFLRKVLLKYDVPMDDLISVQLFTQTNHKQKALKIEQIQNQTKENDKFLHYAQKHLRSRVAKPPVPPTMPHPIVKPAPKTKPIGRTLFMGHPLRYRVKKEPIKIEQIQYIDQAEPVPI